MPVHLRQVGKKRWYSTVGLALLSWAISLVLLVAALAGLIGRLAPVLLPVQDLRVLALLIVLPAMLIGPLQRSIYLALDRFFFRERVNFRRVLQEFGSSLAQVIDLPELSHLILQRAVNTLRLDAASLYLFNQSSGTYRLYEALGAVEANSALIFAETDPFIQSLRVAHRAVYRYDESGAWLNEMPAEERLRVNHLRALLFLPLVAKSHMVGWLNLGAPRSGVGYGPEDLELLNVLADRAATAIENAQLFAEHERRLTELAVLNEIGQSMNSVRSLGQVLETIYNETGRLMDTSNFYIALYDAQKGLVTFPLNVENGQRVPLPDRREENSLTEYMLRTRQPLLIAERVEEKVQSLGVDLLHQPVASYLGVPILREGAAIGVIALRSVQDEFAYDVEDLAILNAIAVQAAIAIENVRLYEMTDQVLSRRLQESTVLADFARTLATVALDPAQVAEQTLSRAVETLGAQAGILLRPEQDGQLFVPIASRGWPDVQEWQATWQALLLALLDAGTQTVPCRADELNVAVPEIAGAPIQLICPLIREDSLLAILHLALPAEAEPDDGRRRFLRHLADHAAVALENALLYLRQVQHREALDYRAAQLASILKLGVAIRANMEFEQILHFVVEAVGETLGFETVVLSVVDEELPDRLRRVAWVGFDAEQVRLLQAEKPPLRLYEELTQGNCRVSHSCLLYSGNEVAWQEILDRYSAYPSVTSLRPDQQQKTCTLIVPLRGAGDRLVGLLALSGPAGGVLPGQDAIEVAEILANQAAVVIENARLYQALRQAYVAKGEFLSLVAHELQVPMGTLWSYADLLDKGSETVDVESLRGVVRVLKTNVARLDALVHDLLEVSRIEAGNFKLNAAPLNAGEVVLESLATVRPMLERKGLTLKAEVPLDLPVVLADRDRLGQVVDNLLSNAYKYTPAPGTVAVSLRLVKAAEELNGTGPERASLRCPCALISVQDTGIGFSRQDQKKLFARFFRAEHPAVRQEIGTGLGLYLVRLLVEAQAGQVWAISDPGQGSSFHVAMPLAGARE